MTKQNCLVCERKRVHVVMLNFLTRSSYVGTHV